VCSGFWSSSFLNLAFRVNVTQRDTAVCQDEVVPPQTNSTQKQGPARKPSQCITHAHPHWRDTTQSPHPRSSLALSRALLGPPITKVLVGQTLSCDHCTAPSAAPSSNWLSSMYNIPPSRTSTMKGGPLKCIFCRHAVFWAVTATCVRVCVICLFFACLFGCYHSARRQSMCSCVQVRVCMCVRMCVCVYIRCRRCGRVRMLAQLEISYASQDQQEYNHFSSRLTGVFPNNFLYWIKHNTLETCLIVRAMHLCAPLWPYVSSCALTRHPGGTSMVPLLSTTLLRRRLPLRDPENVQPHRSTVQLRSQSFFPSFVLAAQAKVCWRSDRRPDDRQWTGCKQWGVSQGSVLAELILATGLVKSRHRFLRIEKLVKPVWLHKNVQGCMKHSRPDKSRIKLYLQASILEPPDLLCDLIQFLEFRNTRSCTVDHTRFTIITSQSKLMCTLRMCNTIAILLNWNLTCTTQLLPWSWWSCHRCQPSKFSAAQVHILSYFVHTQAF